jgi:hypothetical protein
VVRYERYAVGSALILIALAMLVLGYVLGDPWVIYRKAATVCLECIGVG